MLNKKNQIKDHLQTVWPIKNRKSKTIKHKWLEIAIQFINVTDINLNIQKLVFPKFQWKQF